MTKPVNERITPLILSGGAGTRLWPASREGRPKQFLRLFGSRSTFQETVLRVSDPAVFTTPIVLTNAAYRFLVLEELQEIGLEADIVLEPMRRDSGPAIAAGAAFAAARDPNAIVLALAADHLVTEPDAFVATCRDGLAAAIAGRIVTFGITPDHPATGYGYIRPGASLGGRVHAVERFVEKPDVETATRYLTDGYLWNSGNFMFRASMLLDEYRSVDAPSVAAVSDAVAKAGRDLAFITLDEESFGRARPISIDYAVMEKTKMAAVIPASYGWSDVGSWQSVWELSGKDENGNTARGTAVFQDARNNHVSTDRALVALSGVEKSCGGRHAGRYSGGEPGQRRRHEGSHRAAETGGARRDRGTSARASPMGRLSVARHQRTASGQAHHGEGGRAAVVAEAQIPLGALDRGARRRPRDDRRHHQDGQRERVRLYSARCGAPAGESGPGACWN